jgi:hypothetical protein
MKRIDLERGKVREKARIKKAGLPSESYSIRMGCFTQVVPDAGLFRAKTQRRQEGREKTPLRPLRLCVLARNNPTGLCGNLSSVGHNLGWFTKMPPPVLLRRGIGETVFWKNTGCKKETSLFQWFRVPGSGFLVLGSWFLVLSCPNPKPRTQNSELKAILCFPPAPAPAGC